VFVTHPRAEAVLLGDEALRIAKTPELRLKPKQFLCLTFKLITLEW
jgi:ABC-type nitrate/sulfonate/bicarbonate transport system ATPase subunit